MDTAWNEPEKGEIRMERGTPRQPRRGKASRRRQYLSRLLKGQQEFNRPRAGGRVPR